MKKLLLCVTVLGFLVTDVNAKLSKSAIARQEQLGSVVGHESLGELCTAIERAENTLNEAANKKSGMQKKIRTASKKLKNLLHEVYNYFAYIRDGKKLTGLTLSIESKRKKAEKALKNFNKHVDVLVVDDEFMNAYGDKLSTSFADTCEELEKLKAKESELEDESESKDSKMKKFAENFYITVENIQGSIEGLKRKFENVSSGDVRAGTPTAIPVKQARNADRRRSGAY